MLSIRMAYAYTGKYKIAKFEGHYHRGYDQVLLSVNPSLKSARTARNPIATPESKGIHPDQLKNIVIVPFNDLAATTEILTKYKDELAAVILAPIQGGLFPRK